MPTPRTTVAISGASGLIGGASLKADEFMAVAESSPT